MNGLRVGALILGLVAGLLSLSQAAAQEETIAIGSATIAVGGDGSVELAAANIGEPGLAAWSIDVFYDPDVVVAVECAPKNGSVCNPNYAANTVRVTGASAAGFQGDTPLALLTFKCLARGTTALTIGSLTFADNTLGDPQPIEATIVNGSIHCEALVPATDTMDNEATPVTPTMVDAGTGPGDLGIDNWSLVIAGLIGAGIAWLIVGVGGAGLSAVTASAVPWRRSREPGDSIAGVAALAARTEPDSDSLPKWLAAAQRRLSGTDTTALPAFRRSRRRDQ